jgi:hypothetical protein
LTSMVVFLSLIISYFPLFLFCQKISPLFSHPVFLFTATRLIWNCHLQKPSLNKWIKNLVPELGAVRPFCNFQKSSYSSINQALMQYFNLVPTWSPLGPDSIHCSACHSAATILLRQIVRTKKPESTRNSGDLIPALRQRFSISTVPMPRCNHDGTARCLTSSWAHSSEGVERSVGNSEGSYHILYGRELNVFCELQQGQKPIGHFGV